MRDKSKNVKLSYRTILRLQEFLRFRIRQEIIQKGRKYMGKFAPEETTPIKTLLWTSFLEDLVFLHFHIKGGAGYS